MLLALYPRKESDCLPLDTWHRRNGSPAVSFIPCFSLGLFFTFMRLIDQCLSRDRGTHLHGSVCIGTLGRRKNILSVYLMSQHTNRRHRNTRRTREEKEAREVRRHNLIIRTFMGRRDLTRSPLSSFNLFPFFFFSLFSFSEMLHLSLLSIKCVTEWRIFCLKV